MYGTCMNMLHVETNRLERNVAIMKLWGYVPALFLLLFTPSFINTLCLFDQGRRNPSWRHRSTSAVQSLRVRVYITRNPAMAFSLGLLHPRSLFRSRQGACILSLSTNRFFFPCWLTLPHFLGTTERPALGTSRPVTQGHQGPIFSTKLFVKWHAATNVIHLHRKFPGNSFG